MLLEIFFVAILAWLLHMHFEQKRHAVNLPGPKGVPLLGYLFELSSHFHLKQFKLIEKYGKSIYFNIMNEHFVSIADPKLIKELFTLDQITGRPVFDLFLLYEGEALGIVNTEGNLWESHRRFTLRQLRDFGFGKNTMETLIMDEVHELVDRLKGKKGEPVGGIKEIFSLAVVNSLWTIVSGKRYNHDDPKLRAITFSLHRALTAAAESGGIIFFLPWLRYIIPEKSGYKPTRDAFEQLKEFVKEAVEDHEKTFQPEECRDFIDVYLKEIKSEKDSNSPFYGKAAEKQLVAVVGDLFFAGTDTTSTTLAWAMLYLTTYQDAQEKLYQEISMATGNSRDVSLTDRPSMPYLQATMDEVFRMSTILPNGVNHSVISDVTHRGVTYPKGTMIWMNAYYIHRNAETWGDPDNFRPERFLTEDGSSYKKSENVLPFSIGRRQCIGEPLARDTIFLFIANIVQQFKLVFEPNKPNPSLDPAVGFSLNPQEYRVIFKSRNE